VAIRGTTRGFGKLMGEVRPPVRPRVGPRHSLVMAAMSVLPDS